MIAIFEFIDKNVDGDKERLTGATVQLYNKLSAEEANLLRDKLNETIIAVNTIAVPLYPDFQLKYKAEGNTDLSSLEIGDIVGGFYDADTVWDLAIYNGGDPTVKSNYTQLDGSKKSAFNEFKFIQKGFGNNDLNANEIGDIFCGWSNDGTIRIHEAIWIGGALNDAANFTPLLQTEI